MIPQIKNRITFNEVIVFLAIGLKHLRLMALLMCFSLSLGLAYFVYARPVYFTRGLIRMLYTPRVLDTEHIYRDTMLRSIKGQLQSPHIVDLTIKALDEKIPARKVTKSTLIKLRVAGNAEGNLEVEVWPTILEVAELWTETQLEVYLRARDELRMLKRESIVEGYTEDLMRIRKKIEEFADEKSVLGQNLKSTEAQIELKGLEGLPDVLLRVNKRIAALESVRPFLADESLDIVSRLALLARATRAANLSVGQVVPMSVARGAMDGTGRDGSNTVVVPSMVVSAQHPWEALERQQQQLEAQLQELGKTYLPGHPKVAAVREQIEEIERKLRGELEILRGRYELEYAQLVDERKKLEETFPIYRERTEAYEKIQRDMRTFSDSRLAWEKMYQNVAQKLESVSFAESAERIEMDYMGLLQLNRKPVSPHRMKLLLYSLVLGVGLALAVPFLLEFLDHTISLLDQVEDDLGLRGLGVVPLVGEHVTTPMAELLISAPENRALRETFRIMRTNILTDKDAKGERQVLMVCSTVPREGKSMVSVNLSLAFSQLGEKTLLVDADLHRGSQHRLFGVSSRPGLSAALAEGLPLDEVCIPTAYPNLDILPGGKHMRNTQELIVSPTFKEFMAGLRQRYQRIVIDTPPILGLAETPALAPQADGVVLVVWSGHTPVTQVKAAKDMLAANGATFLGCVLNRLDLSAATSYYYYYYYSDYYYHSYDRTSNDSEDEAEEAEA